MIGVAISQITELPDSIVGIYFDFGDTMSRINSKATLAFQVISTNPLF